MTFLPIVERELRQQARRPRTYWARFAAVLVGVMIALGLLSPSFHGVIAPDQTGRALFLTLGGLAFAYALLSGVFTTADCISEEKRDGTLGLLFLTDLSGHDVVAGKLAGRSLNAIYGLVAVFPVLALALLFGGVTAGEFWRATLALLNTLFLSAAIGMGVSVRGRDGRLAMAATLLGVMTLAVVPWLFTNLRAPLAAGSLSPFLLASPLLAAALVTDAHFAVHSAAFAAALGVQHMLGWLALVWAALNVRGSWQEQRRRPVSRAWGRLGVVSGGNGFSAVLVPAAVRARWLEQNPVLWLAWRDRWWRGNVPLFFTLGLCAALMGWLTLRSVWQAPLLAALTAWVLHAVVKLWLAAEACRLLHDARQNGALELLLVTPLRQADIVNGLLASVKRRFGSPVALVLVVDILLLMFITSLGAGGELALSLVFFVMAGIFLADTYTLTWVGLWQGMAAPTLTRAFLGTVNRVLLMPWAVFVGFSGALVFLNEGRPPSEGTLMALWFAASYVTNGVLCAVSINRVTADFRDMAAREQSLGLLRELVRFFRSESPAGGSRSAPPQPQLGRTAPGSSSSSPAST